MIQVLFSSWIKKEFNLDENTSMIYCTWEIVRPFKGYHRQDTRPTKRRENLKPHGSFDVSHTLGPWKHKQRPTQLSLECGHGWVKYNGK